MNKTISNIIFWKLAIIKWLIGSFKVAALAYLSGVAARAWMDMNWDARIQVLLAAGIAVATFTDAFLDQTVARIAAGKPPIGPNGNGHVEITTTADVQTQTQTQIETTTNKP